MRKKLYQTGIVSLLLLFAIVLLGCGTAKMGVYSSSLQQPDPDKLCNLRIHYSTGITGIDGKAVSWGIAREVKYTEISIPAGLHSMRFEFFSEDEYSRVQASNYTFSYEFLPGHNYEIIGGYGVVRINNNTDKSLSKSISIRL